MDLEIDGQKLYLYMDRVNAALRGELLAPITVEVSPTNRCNNNCIFCGLDYRRDKLRDLPINFTIALKDLIRCGVRGFTFAGEGEPTLNPYTTKFVQVVKDHGAASGLMTNGIDLTIQKIETLLPNLSWIRFSINANTKETYSKVHGVKEHLFDSALDGVKRAIEFKRVTGVSCAIGIQSLCLDENKDEIRDLAKRTKELGADYFTLKPYSQHPKSNNKRKNNTEELLDFYTLGRDLLNLTTPTFQAIVRTKAFARAIIKKGNEHCFAAPHFMVIDSKGDCYPCASFIGTKSECFGSVYHTNSTLFGKRRKRILRKHALMDCSKCRTPCRLDAANEFIEKKVIGILHKEFI